MESQEKADRVKEQGPTNLYLLRSETTQDTAPRILIGARDTGTANSLSPVIDQLIERGYQISVLTDKPAEHVLNQRFNLERQEINSPLQVVDGQDLILSGVSATDPITG